MELKRVKWLPFAVDGSPGMFARRLRPQFAKDFQTAWFWNLFWASLEAEPQGYLDPRLPLGKLAGAHSDRFWSRHKDAVLARFELREWNSVEMLCFPPLIEVIESQMKRIRQHRAREEFSTDSQPSTGGAGFPLPSQSSFAFDFQELAQKQKPSTTRVWTQEHHDESAAKRGVVYSQADFDARDLRIYRQALERWRGTQEASIGCHFTTHQLYAWLAGESCLTIERILELERLLKKWPEGVPLPEEGKEEVG